MAINREVRTQAELDALLAAHPRSAPVLVGDAHFSVRDSSHVEAWDSSHVVAWDSSHVVAWDSSHVEAWDSSHVEARESSHVEAWGSSRVEASVFVAVHQHSERAVVLGGTIIRVRRPETVLEWAACYGVPILNGRMMLYKAVRDDYRSAHGTLYAPGQPAEAPDWDGGKAECGAGLHFSPHPAMAQEFDAEATRFVACPVAVEDCRAPSPSDDYPHKIKARRVCGPIIAVNRDGTPIQADDVERV